jgi:hypothetical protein
MPEEAKPTCGLSSACVWAEGDRPQGSTKASGDPCSAQMSVRVPCVLVLLCVSFNSALKHPWPASIGATPPWNPSFWEHGAGFVWRRRKCGDKAWRFAPDPAGRQDGPSRMRVPNHPSTLSRSGNSARGLLEGSGKDPKITEVPFCSLARF